MRETPPDHFLLGFESEDNFMSALCYIFVKLKEYLEKGFLPYYFIPQINLIEGIKAKLSEKAIEWLALSGFTLNVKKYLPDNKRRVVVGNWIELLDVVLYRALDFIEASKNFGTYIAYVISDKYAINNVIKQVSNKDGCNGNHAKLKTFFRLKKDTSYINNN